jgi:hypothetical protein
LLHVLHGTLIGQDFAGRGVYVYVPDGTTWRVGEGGYECAKAPDELALRLGQERLIGHHHVANPLDQPAVGRAAGYALIDRRSDVVIFRAILAHVLSPKMWQRFAARMYHPGSLLRGGETPEEREPTKETIERGTLFFLWHPGTEQIFSGYGLAMRPGSNELLAGLLMVDRPRPAETMCNLWELGDQQGDLDWAE